MILQHQFLLVGLFLLMISKRCGSISVDVHSQFLDLPRTESIICYQCTDCPEPFVEAYPYVTKVNNSNFLAQCTVIDRYFDNDSRQTEYFQKTIMNLGEGRRLISKGSVFFCPAQTSVTDVQVLCCDHDYCNSSSPLQRWFSSVRLLLLSCILIYS